MRDTNKQHWVLWGGASLGRSIPRVRHSKNIGVIFIGLLRLTAPAARAQFTFTINNGTVTLTRYTGPGGDVTIPNTLDGLPVTDTGTNAFYRDGNLNGITTLTGASSYFSDPEWTNYPNRFDGFSIP